MKNVFCALLGLLCFLVSCTDDSVKPVTVQSVSDSSTNISADKAKEECMVSFAQILSAATFDNKDVREFLKTEALKKFDKNYDILYLAVKDEMIGDLTF